MPLYSLSWTLILQRGCVTGTDILTCKCIKMCWEDWRPNYFYNCKKKSNGIWIILLFVDKIKSIKLILHSNFIESPNFTLNERERERNGQICILISFMDTKPKPKWIDFF